MSQSSIPVWVTVILGGGGLIGVSTLLFNLFKQVTDAKDETIRGLKEQINNVEGIHQREVRLLEVDYQSKLNRLQQDNEQLKAELTLVKNFRTLLEETIETLETQGTTEEASSSVRQLKNLVRQLQTDEEGLTPFRNASQWVRQSRDRWLQEISDAAISSYQELLQDKEDLFRKDISNYLTWLSESLYDSILFKFREYVEHPSVSSSFPYRYAFKYLRQKRDFGDLTALESEYLQDYLDELIKFLQNQPEQ